MAFKSDQVRLAIDKVGVFASLLCAVHCIAMPLLLTVMPLLGLSFFLDSGFEKGFVIVFIVIAILNTCWGYKDHKKHSVLVLSLVGSTLLIISNFFYSHSHGHAHHDHSHHGHGHMHEAVRPQDSSENLILLIVGALMLAGGHILNGYFCKKCSSCADDHC
jgi:hypothetical protein